MKVNIDREGCISCGACWMSCPDFFEQSPKDDKSQVKAAYRAGSEGEGTVPKDQEDCVEGAADACPVQVIGNHQGDPSLEREGRNWVRISPQPFYSYMTF